MLVRSLGEAWQPLVAVEFEVESLGSDPTALLCPDPALVRIGFNLASWRSKAEPSSLRSHAPCSKPRASPLSSRKSQREPEQADFERNLALLENAQVELEVRLQGPTLAVTEILALKAGHVITFDYSLNKSLHGLVNGELAIMGRIVGAGRKRAFQVDQLP